MMKTEKLIKAATEKELIEVSPYMLVHLAYYKIKW